MFLTTVCKKSWAWQHPLLFLMCMVIHSLCFATAPLSETSASDPFLTKTVLLPTALPHNRANNKNWAKNGDLEQGNTQGWQVFGQSSISISEQSVGNGKYALFVDRRRHPCDGVSQDIRHLKNGTKYHISFALKLADPGEVSFRTTVTFNYDRYVSLNGANNIATHHNWTIFNGTYTHRSDKNDTVASLYFESDDSLASYFIDNLVITELLPPKETKPPKPLKAKRNKAPSLPSANDKQWAAAVQASRFLAQASFGATAQDIRKVINMGEQAWISEQLLTPTTRQLPRVEQRFRENDLEVIPDREDFSQGYIRDLQRTDVWWETVLRGEDQLRQRVAFALSQILVVSNTSDQLYADVRGIAHYHDMLADMAFGNYRDLLEAVTLSQPMGEYLSMINNEKADTARNIRPDENYAREILQLFSIGLVELNLDGSIVQDAQGQPIATYNQDIIKAFARVFTGWTFAEAFDWNAYNDHPSTETLAMKAIEDFHDREAKILLNGTVLPANQNAITDLRQALDNIFAHKNVAPFISKQLIQRLVTSNPSRGYVERVAKVFNDNGHQIKGDLAAVVTAILLDKEAQQGLPNTPERFGKLKEPLLQQSALWRAFHAHGVPFKNIEGSKVVGDRIRYHGSNRDSGQRLYGASSVFNFFSPDYQPAGRLETLDLKAPEFEILTDSYAIGGANRMAESIWKRALSDPGLWEKNSKFKQGINANWDVMSPRLQLKKEITLAKDSQLKRLIDRVNLLLTAGQLNSEQSDMLYRYLLSMPSDNQQHRRERVYELLMLVTALPEFTVQY